MSLIASCSIRNRLVCIERWKVGSIEAIVLAKRTVLERWEQYFMLTVAMHLAITILARPIVERRTCVRVRRVASTRPESSILLQQVGNCRISWQPTIL